MELLLLLSQFNAESPMPTVFECIAASRMGDSLHAAIQFVLSSLAGSLPVRIIPLLPYYEEGYLFFDAMLQRLYISLADSTTNENIFGMRRSAVITVPVTRHRPANDLPSGTIDGGTVDGDHLLAEATTKSALHTAAPTSGIGAAQGVPALHGLRLGPITDRQRRVGWIVASLGSYLRRRFVNYARWLKSDAPDDREERRRLETLRGGWFRTFNRLVELVIPWVNLTLEVADVAFAVAYVADRTPYASPALWAQGVALRRVTQADIRSESHSTTLRRATGALQVFLMTLAVGFRIFDWWRTAEGRNASTAVLREALPAPAAPQPPPPSTPVSDGICPVCTHPYANPCVNAASGYVFCYPCLHQAITARSRCPVTGIKSSLAHIRRLYEDS